MVQAFSRLGRLLDERDLSVPELQRQLRQKGLNVNVKSLYRLAKDFEPVERLDLRVAGVICQVFDIALTDLIAFEAPRQRLRRLPTEKQKRLDALMTKNSRGELTPAERESLRTLVRETEEITLANARRLATERRQLAD